LSKTIFSFELNILNTIAKNTLKEGTVVTMTAAFLKMPFIFPAIDFPTVSKTISNFFTTA